MNKAEVNSDSDDEDPTTAEDDPFLATPPPYSRRDHPSAPSPRDDPPHSPSPPLLPDPDSDASTTVSVHSTEV
eukprot:TCALIF_01428-PA protein Name:"Protein of unknown function" AED:0.94 eAED:0.94 QI:0/0/0/0.5/1/1/2/0/72